MRKSFLSLLASLLAFQFSHSQTTVTFQEGVNNYFGCDALDISDWNLGQSWNWNGTTFGDGNADWCIGQLHSDPGYGYDIAPLMKFDSLNLPPNAHVISASLTLRVYTWAAGGRIVGQYLNTDWNNNFFETQGGAHTPDIGWISRKPSVNWTSPGATGNGTDLISGLSFTLPDDGSTVAANGYSTYSTALDPGVVQNWIDNPLQNYGVRLHIDTPAVHIGFVHPRKISTTEPKPILSITYTIGSARENEFSFIHQVSPNPFSTQTVLKLKAGFSGDMEITLSDLTGKICFTKSFRGTGADEKEIVIEGNELPNGLLICKITNGEKTECMKLLHLKN